MTTSINKIFKTLETFVSSHEQLSSFSVAPLTEFVAKNWVYPVCWVDLQTTTMSLSKGQIVINMPIYVMDRIERDFSNYSTVVSSSLVSMIDIVTYFNDKGCDLGFDCDLGSSMTVVTYEFDDIVSGIKANILFRTFEDFDEEQIPLK